MKWNLNGPFKTRDLTAFKSGKQNVQWSKILFEMLHLSAAAHQAENKNMHHSERRGTKFNKMRGKH